jgi:hypothetical protein
MKRENWLYPLIAVLVTLGGFFFLVPSKAGITCSLPFNLTNGTTADASQVMANYNALTACMLNNLAASGANNDVTSLSGLTTPLSPAQGGSSGFTGGTSVGTNAITATASPAGFSLTANYKIVFIAGGSNTGATTLNVSGTGVKNLYRPTPQGAVPTVGGEIVTGQIVEAVYDGTEYQMISRPALDHVPGEIFDYGGAAGCPAGSFEANAQTVTTTSYPTLGTVLSTTWGAPGGGLTQIPDLRGRATYEFDGSGARITVAGGNFNGAAVGNVGGQQNNVVNKANLAAFALPVTDPGHSHTYVNQATLAAVQAGASATNFWQNTVTASTGASLTGITVASGGSSTPLPTLSNAAIVLKCVKA